MDLDRWIEHTLEIQAIPAPTFDEAQRGEFMQSEFEAARLMDVHRDSQGNVLARAAGGDARPVLVSAHLDTVFAGGTNLASQRSRSRITGPGIGDNAVALAALIELAHDLVDRPPNGEVWLVANVGEEGLGNLCGMREVVGRFGDSIAAYLVVEGMAFGHIYHRALPVRRYRVSATTKGGHSWIHRGRTSAIHALVQLGAVLLDSPPARAAKTSLNIGTIQGGRSINSIADQARMELDLRSESPQLLGELDLAAQAAVAAAVGPGLHLEVELIGERPAGELPASHPLVRAAVDSLTAAGEKRHFLEAGSTDASIALHRGLPAICVGVTKGGEAHTTDEYIELAPMPQGYQALTDLLQRASKLGQ